jgi:hypothetical protein
LSGANSLTRSVNELPFLLVTTDILHFLEAAKVVCYRATHICESQLVYIQHACEEASNAF